MWADERMLCAQVRAKPCAQMTCCACGDERETRAQMIRLPPKKGVVRRIMDPRYHCLWLAGFTIAFASDLLPQRPFFGLPLPARPAHSGAALLAQSRWSGASGATPSSWPEQAAQERYIRLREADLNKRTQRCV